MGISQRLAHLLEDLQKARTLLSWARPLLEQLGQGDALDQLHGEIGPAIIGATQLVDGYDAGMLQLTADLCFLAEALHRLGVASAIAPHEFEGEVTAQLG